MFRAGKSITTLAVATSLLVASGIVLAQGVGNIGVLPGPIIPMNVPGGWDIGNPATGPIPVVRDPNGPAWRKVLTDPNGQQFPAVPGQVFTLHESLVVAGNLPWSDWHEKINQPFWDWANPSILVNGVVPAGLSIINNPGNAVTGGGLNFLFNSIVPGSLVDIKKDLVYNGPPGVVFLGALEVTQFPTPEPASLGLLGLGGLILSRRRRATVTPIA